MHRMDLIRVGPELRSPADSCKGSYIKLSWNGPPVTGECHSWLVSHRGVVPECQYFVRGDCTTGEDGCKERTGILKVFGKWSSVTYW